MPAHCWSIDTAPNTVVSLMFLCVYHKIHQTVKVLHLKWLFAYRSGLEEMADQTLELWPPTWSSRFFARKLLPLDPSSLKLQNAYCMHKDNFMTLISYCDSNNTVSQTSMTTFAKRLLRRFWLQNIQTSRWSFFQGVFSVHSRVNLLVFQNCVH
jgi:hypothetical protein